MKAGSVKKARFGFHNFRHVRAAAEDFATTMQLYAKSDTE